MGINQKDDLIETLLKFNKPLSRKKDTMSEFLNKHYSDYISSLRTLKYNSKNIGSKKLYEQISDSISDIEDTGKTCINVLDLYGQANIKDAVNEFEKIGNMFITHTLRTIYFPSNGLYRIRSCKENEIFSNREDLFHISFLNRERIKPYRFSINGYPSLYLSEDKEACWYECFEGQSETSEFFLSGYSMEFKKKREYPGIENGQRRLILIDISTRAVDLFSPAMKAKADGNQETSDMWILKYLKLYPLIAACSCVVTKKTDSFKEEYVIPQLLCSWVAATDDIDGIKYQSLARQDNDYFTFNNLVLPAKNLCSDGFSQNLKSFFKISTPVHIKSKNELNNIEVLEETYDYII